MHFNPVPHSPKRRAKSLHPSKRSNVTIVQHCDEQTTVDCLRALYNINYTPRSTSRNSFGIGSLCCVDFVRQILIRCSVTVELTPQAILDTDLDIFFKYVCNSVCRSCIIKLTLSGSFHLVRWAPGRKST